MKAELEQSDVPQIRDSGSEVISCPIRREVKHCNQKEGRKGLGALGLLDLQDDSGDLPMNASPQMLYPDL